MDYVEVIIPVRDNEQSEIVMAVLSDFSFESFSEERGVLKGYIPRDALSGEKAAIDEALAEMGTGRATYIEIETQNWNALWESNFQPVDVDGLCTIRAPFSPAPQQGLDIVIMPKMSFGTGHHATTYLMSALIMERDFTGMCGLDMGSGTGVLAIIAVKRGATHVDAVDIDEWAFENCAENITGNAVADAITPVLGNAQSIAGKRYDFILANINRNILIADMPAYVQSLNKGGELIVSGILEADIPAIKEKASELGLTFREERLREGWAALCFQLSVSS